MKIKQVEGLQNVLDSIDETLGYKADVSSVPFMEGEFYANTFVVIAATIQGN